VIADKGYSSRANRRLLRERGIGHTIPEKADQAAHRRRRGLTGGRPPGFGPARSARGFCQLKQWRGLATRYDKHARNYPSAINLAALLTWLP
jgi:transposase